MTIYLDLDGVLADFVSGLARAHGLNPASVVASWPAGDYGYMEGLVYDFWAPVKGDWEFWAKLPPYPWAHSLVRRAQRAGDVWFLTAPLDHASKLGKLAWIERHFPGAMPRVIFANAEDKWRYAGRSTLLVDDRRSNVEEWRRHGGHAILFPQVWNQVA